MVIDEDEAEARELLHAAGIGHELTDAAPKRPNRSGPTFLSNLLRKLGLTPK